MYKKIEKCLKLSSEERKKLLSKFQNMSLSDKIECFNVQHAIYIQIRNSYSKDVAQLCAFYKAISSVEITERININSNIFDAFDQNMLLGFFMKQDILVQLKIFEEQKNQYFKNKNILKSDFRALFAFFKAMDIFYSRFKKKFYKNKTLNIKSMNSMIDVNILKDKKQKISIKRERFLNYISVVKRLKEEGYSYRKMSLHFEKYYKYNASHTYLRKMFKEFLEEVNGL